MRQGGGMLLAEFDMRPLLVVCAGLAVFQSVGCRTDPMYVLHPGLEEPRYTRYAHRGITSETKKKIVLYRSNYLAEPVCFEPGQRVEIKSYSDIRLDLTIGGAECEMLSRDHNFPTDPAGIERFLEKHFGRNPFTLGSVERSKRNLIVEGKVALGMSRNDVVMAIGYPSHVGPDRVPAGNLEPARISEHDEWVYRYDEVIRGLPSWWTYIFDSAGTVTNIER